MKIETALNHRKRALGAVKSLYSTAPIFGMESADLNQRYSYIMETVTHCPAWVREFCDGYRAALQDSLYADSLMFGGWIDGVFYSVHSARPDYYGKHGISPADYADDGRVTGRGHYWKTTKEPKPYFTGAE